jgi:hypothetical protein
LKKQKIKPKPKNKPMKTTKNTNTDLLTMTVSQLEREVEYYQIRSFAVILTEAENERLNEAQELLNKF